MAGKAPSIEEDLSRGYGNRRENIFSMEFQPKAEQACNPARMISERFCGGDCDWSNPAVATDFPQRAGGRFTPLLSYFVWQRSAT